jgi:probable F420-dependent oxidoreductase
MKIGIAIFPTDFTMRPDELARAVEERGFESLFFSEHTHIPATARSRAAQGELPPFFSHTHDLFAALSYAAAATTDLLVGSGVCLMAQRDPIATAKTVASLDMLSGGRLLFGVGAGWLTEEIENHGIAPEDRWSVMGEHVQAMQRIWTQDEAEFHGKHLEFGPLLSWPKPRPLHPPVLVGGSGPHVSQRVIEYGDGWMPIADIDHAVLADRITALRRDWEAAGRSGEVEVTTIANDVDPDPDTLESLRRIGVSRAVFHAPPAETGTVLRFLDRAAHLAAPYID